jgi:hypothetical protein
VPDPGAPAAASPGRGVRWRPSRRRPEMDEQLDESSSPIPGGPDTVHIPAPDEKSGLPRGR